jgi:hypothetical protein
MAFTRPMYDQCSEPLQTSQNNSIYNRQMDTSKYYSCSQARVPFGLFGGNQVSITTGNMVNLETTLRGQGQGTRLTNCPNEQVQPNCMGCDQPGSGIPCASSCPLPERKTHLSDVMFAQYPKRPTSNGITNEYPTCSYTSDVKTTRPPINSTYNMAGSSYNPIQWK